MRLLDFVKLIAGGANPLVSVLVNVAELFFSTPQSGTSKKAFVQQAITTVAAGVPGLQGDLDQVKQAVDPLIEDAVKALNSAKQVVQDIEVFVRDELNLG